MSVEALGRATREGRRTGNDQAAPESILGRQQSVNFLPLKPVVFRGHFACPSRGWKIPLFTELLQARPVR
jgi:hypothetical protein